MKKKKETARERFWRTIEEMREKNREPKKTKEEEEMEREARIKLLKKHVFGL